MGPSSQCRNSGSRTRVTQLGALPDSAVFDSNILIDFLNQRPEARAAIEAVSARYVSVETRAEILTGVRDARSKTSAGIILAMCVMCDVTVEIADRAAIVRQDHRLKLPDALVAATAGELGLALLTRDDAMARLPGAIVPYRLQ